MTVSKIYFRYFEDQHSVTLVDNSKNPIANSFMCFGIFRPVDIYSSFSRLRLNSTDKKSSVSSYPSTEGFALKIGKADVSSTLRVIASHNPRTKVLALLDDSPVQETKKILHQAYHDFKILGVALINIRAEYLDGQYLKTAVELFMFNPFVMDDSSLVTFKFTQTNAGQVLADFDQFISSRARNLHMFPVRVSIFDYPMVSKPEYDENGRISHYSYVDGETIATMAKYMNFTPLYVEPEYAKYGFQFANGTFCGSLGDIEYGKAELAANPKLISNYNTENAIFLQPITTDKLMFIIRKRETKKAIIFAIYSEYDQASQIMNLTLLLILPVAYIFVSRTEQKLHNPGQKVTSIGRSLMLIYAISYNISTKLPKGDCARVVISTAVFYTLIVNTLLQSTIIKNLNTNKEFGKITTIEQLASEGYTIKMPGYLVQIFKQPGLNKVSWMLEKTKQKHSDLDSDGYDLEKIMPKNKKIAFLWTEMYAANYLDQFYDKDTGQNLFEAVPEPAFEFYIALMAPKHSPLIESFNDFMLRYIESNVGFHHVSMAVSEIDRFRIQRIKEGIVPRQKTNAIKFKDVNSVFVLYVSCVLVATVVFITEVLISRCKSYLNNKKSKS